MLKQQKAQNRLCSFMIWCLFFAGSLLAQNTNIQGEVDVLSTYEKRKLSFGFGEQDFFITSSILNRFLFLGESVFRFGHFSLNELSINLGHIIPKYNDAGNHNILAGKHDAPLNYWNNTYHRGRVFFSTVCRPFLFSANMIPLHTTGFNFQDPDVNKISFGYHLMAGNKIFTQKNELNFTF